VGAASVQPLQLGVGDVVSICFGASKPVRRPNVTINGMAVQVDLIVSLS
jgi:hypothetical protein